MHFPDLGTKTQVAQAPFVRAVGWLGEGHPFPTGEVADPIKGRLDRFAARWGKSTEALGWPTAGGSHECELCGAFYAGGNFGVPAGEILYVCPEMVAHYVGTHDYRPPDAFQAALLVAPVPGTSAYRLAVRPFRVWFEGRPS